MRRASLALGFALLTGCSFLVDLSTLGGSADGSTNDSAVDSGGLVNPGFEQTGGGCGPGWSTNNAVLNTSTTAHSGASSCRMCVKTPGQAAYLTAIPHVGNLVVGTTYFAEAYMMIEADASLSSAALYVSESITNGSKSKGTQDAVLTDPTWQQVQVESAPVDDAGSAFIYNVLLTPVADGGGCVLVDDAVFFAQ